jgi:hypothetical protein
LRTRGLLRRLTSNGDSAAGATARIVGSIKHEGYVPNAEDEAIHQQALRGEITSEEVIAIFRERGLKRVQKALTRKRPQPV